MQGKLSYVSTLPTEREETYKGQLCGSTNIKIIDVNESEDFS